MEPLLMKGLIMLTVHWICDYGLQNRWMGNNKSKSMLTLWAHVTVYTTATCICWYFLGLVHSWIDVMYLFTCTAALHSLTDALTSRLTKWLYANKYEYLTYLVMGLDQLLHAIQLFYTYQYLN